MQIFHWYIAFCSFAVLNVMTGAPRPQLLGFETVWEVFCHSAISAAEQDHLKLIENRKRRLFKSL